MLAISGIEHIAGPPFYHQTIRGFERVNGTSMRELRKLSSFERKEWKELIMGAGLTVNLSSHRALDTFLFIWIYKRLPELGIDKHIGSKNDS